jgi:hypothetical protein
MLGPRSGGNSVTVCAASSCWIKSVGEGAAAEGEREGQASELRDLVGRDAPSVERSCPSAPERAAEMSAIR